jgi:hypothetical protein
MEEGITFEDFENELRTRIQANHRECEYLRGELKANKKVIEELRYKLDRAKFRVSEQEGFVKLWDGHDCEFLCSYHYLYGIWKQCPGAPACQDPQICFSCRRMTQIPLEDEQHELDILKAKAEELESSLCEVLLKQKNMWKKTEALRKKNERLEKVKPVVDEASFDVVTDFDAMSFDDLPLFL